MNSRFFYKRLEPTLVLVEYALADLREDKKAADEEDEHEDDQLAELDALISNYAKLNRLLLFVVNEYNLDGTVKSIKQSS